MNFIRKIMQFAKHIFSKQEIKLIDAPKQINQECKKTEFAKSLQVKETKNTNQREVETLICRGDGLGIQTKMSS